MSADYFSVGSLGYVRYRSYYPTAWFDWIVSRCAGRNLAWDCACGSGQATEELAKRFGRVVGTDASEGQLRRAPAIPNVEWTLACGEESGLETGSVDLVTVAQALHWFELERFCQECRRVLRPYGLVAVWGYRTASLGHEAADGIFQDFYHGVLGVFGRRNGKWSRRGMKKSRFRSRNWLFRISRWFRNGMLGKSPDIARVGRLRIDIGRRKVPIPSRC